MGAEEQKAAGVMAREYGVFVVTPPPSETILVARAPTALEAIFAAFKWGGKMLFNNAYEAVSEFGEKVYIEEIKTPLRRGKPLGFLHWDEIFETGVFEQYLAPELGFHLAKYGEVVKEEREAWETAWKKIESWLMAALQARGIEAYSLQGREIYPADLKDMARELERDVPKGPREWAPAGRLWQPAMARALKEMLKENE
jgi:hypothetical protein